MPTKLRGPLLVLLLLAALTGAAQTRVLELDGTNSFVELPPNIFNNLEQATIEMWVKWERLGGPGWNRAFNYGGASRDVSIGTLDADSLWFVVVDPQRGLQSVTVPSLLRTGDWCHVAAVSGKGGMRLYFNGVLVGQNAYDGSFSATKDGQLNRLGKTVTNNDNDPPFKGQISNCGYGARSGANRISSALCLRRSPVASLVW